MKRVLLNLLLIIIISSIAVGCGKKQQPMDLYDSIKQRGSLVVGVEKNIKPFSFKNSNDQQDGFEVDIAKQMARAILGDENAIEFVMVEPSNRISYLNSGQADMLIATLTITPTRQGIVDFSDPYYIAGQTVLINKQSGIKSFADLNKKKIGVTFGTTALEGIKTAIPDCVVQGYKTYDEGYNALKSGEIDAFASDDTILMGYELSDNSVKMLSQKYTQEPYGIAFRKGTESLRTIEVANNVINLMKDNGKMTQLKNKWFKK